jgi:hypothetical protein
VFGDLKTLSARNLAEGTEGSLLIICDFQCPSGEIPAAVLSVANKHPVFIQVISGNKIRTSQGLCRFLEGRHPSYSFRHIGEPITGSTQSHWISMVQRKPTALLIHGASLSGKSSLARSYSEPQTVHADDEILTLFHCVDDQWSDLRDSVLNGLLQHNLSRSISDVYRAGLFPELFRFLMRNVDHDSDVVIDIWMPNKMKKKCLESLLAMNFKVFFAADGEADLAGRNGPIITQVLRQTLRSLRK